MAPALLVLSDRRQAERAGNDLVGVLATAAAAGATVVLREKDLDRPDRTVLAERVVVACGPASVLIASDAELARHVGAAGVHLAADDAPHPTTRAGESLLVGRSWHGAEPPPRDADYLTLSPVFATASKPGYGPPLGLGGLRRGVRAAAQPVVALGGLDAPRSRQCRAAGAAGVAVMGAVMRAADPAGVIDALIEAAPMADPPPGPVREEPAGRDRGARTS